MNYIFNHVPKTGGISLLAICQHNLASSQISPHLRDDQVRMSEPDYFDGFRLIAGHFGLSSHSRIAGDRYSMTLLREPVRTIFSTYTFWRGSPERNTATLAAKELSFPDFVRYFEWSPAVIFNPFTHHFAGMSREIWSDDTSGTALLATAKHNLTAFDFVGICEEYERSARLLCRELGWQVPTPLPHENRSRSEMAIGTIDDQTLQLLHERNRLDSELYAFAVGLFHEREWASLNEGVGGLNEGEGHRPKRVGFLPFPTPTETSRQAKVEAVSAEWLSVQQSQVLEIAIRFRTKVQIADLIVGMAIFDAVGHNVWGTNTAHEGLEVHHEPDCTCNAVFALHCSIPAGSYSVTVALHRPRCLGFHEHWLDRATSFEVPERIGQSDYDGIKLREFRSSVGRAFGVCADKSAS